MFGRGPERLQIAFERLKCDMTLGPPDQPDHRPVVRRLRAHEDRGTQGRTVDPRGGPGNRGRRAAALTAALAVLAAACVALAPASAAPQAGLAAAASAAEVECDPPAPNAIVCENGKPGNPKSEWDITGAGDTSIQGFTTDMSVDQSQTVRFKVKTSASAYRLDIYRMGYYGGNGARKVATVTPSASLPQSQPACLNNASTGLIDCGNWAESASWAVPADAVSGIYFAKLVRNDTGGASHVFFIVRDDDGRSDMVFQTSDTTWQAYNTYGGNSLYRGNPAGRAYKVSYNRPFDTRGNGEDPSWVFAAEYPLVRWLERNGYDVSYTTGVDSERRGAELLEHKLYLSVGHDEYWSAGQRTNVEAARAAGVHLAFFSGNEIYWKTRWEPSIDGTNTQHRTLVSYKEDQTKIDPANVWTGTWGNPVLGPQYDARPQNALTGTLFGVDGEYRRDQLEVPAEYGNLRFWRNTSVATLAPGTKATFAAGTLGFEWDEDRDNGHRPPGMFNMSSTSLDVNNRLTEPTGFAPGRATHNLTFYRHPGGALVWGTGTVQWSWGLDSNHDTFSNDASPPTDVRMQQATVNVFADMGLQPTTLQTGLTAATQSTDTALPTATITSPSSGASVPSTGTVTISGTAADTGGVVAAVEVSTNGGATWNRAAGRSSWTYSWSPNTGPTGPLTLKARAIDDTANIGNPHNQLVNVEQRAGLVGAWSFDEGSGTNAADASGSGNTGTLAGAGWNASGRFGKAVSFDGVNDWVSVADSASLDVTSGITIEAWLRPTALSGWDTGVMKESGSNFVYTLYTNTSSNRPSGFVGASEIEGSAQLPLNTWTHVAITYDRSNLRMYVNGTQNGVQPATAAIPTSSGPLRFGGNGVWDEWFAGLIDEVRVYNRALTATEVQGDMNTGIGGAPPPPDTTPPTVSVTAPAAGATVSGTNVTVSANASDNVGVAGVQFKLDGANLGAEDTSAPYSHHLGYDSRRERAPLAHCGSPRRRGDLGRLGPRERDGRQRTRHDTADRGGYGPGRGCDRLRRERDSRRERGGRRRRGRRPVQARRRRARPRGHDCPVLGDVEHDHYGERAASAVCGRARRRRQQRRERGRERDRGQRHHAADRGHDRTRRRLHGVRHSGSRLGERRRRQGRRGRPVQARRCEPGRRGHHDAVLTLVEQHVDAERPAPAQRRGPGRRGEPDRLDARDGQCAERGADAAGPGGGVLVRRGVGGDRGGRLWDGQRRDDLGGDLERGRPVRVGAVVRRHERLGDGGGCELARPHDRNDARSLGATDRRRRLAHRDAEGARSGSLLRPVLELQLQPSQRLRRGLQQ